MNEFKVLAIKTVSFTDDRGKLVSGYQLWLYGQTYEPGWQDGYEVLKAWIPDESELADLVADLSVGTNVTVKFSRRGKVIDLGEV